MCGIAGLFSINPINVYKKSKLDCIQNDLKTRGPDGYGSFEGTFKNILLKHTRLSIQDQSINGKQPMTYEHLSISFNGEIYNFKNIRKHLSSLGYTFFSNSDTEVILKAYHCFGKECVKKLDGQFSFSIWDNKKQELFMARDIFGKKPLYYIKTDSEFWFSSSLPALVRHSGITPVLSSSSIYFYFSMGVIPSPYTPFKNFNKLPAGYMATIKYSDDKSRLVFSESCYKKIQYKNNKLNIDENDAKNLFKKNFTNSVKKRVDSDAETGVWLSGGLDSSLIVAIAKKELGINLPTFSIGFENIDDNKGDEFKYSNYVAKKFNTFHHKLYIPTRYIVDDLKDCYTNLNEPMWAYDIPGHFLLSKYSPKNLKVALSGVGADEFWLGYHWHNSLQNIDLSCKELFSVFIKDADELGEYIEKSYLKPLAIDNYIDEYSTKLNKQKNSEFEKLLQWESSLFLVDDCLKRADNTGMRHGVEIRAPFLDENLVNFSTQLSVSLKLKNGIGKYLVKKVSQDYFDDSFIFRKKGYFPVTPVQYMSKQVKGFCKEIIYSNHCKNRKIYKMDFLYDILNKDKLSQLDISILWKITCLECWLSQFNI